MTSKVLLSPSVTAAAQQEEPGGEGRAAEKSEDNGARGVAADSVLPVALRDFLSEPGAQVDGEGGRSWGKAPGGASN